MNRRIGIADDAFIRGRVPMTKQEVRILTLAKAAVGEKDVVIDVGAGTGSLSVEAALLAREGRVYAVERGKEGAELIQQNAAKFNVSNLTVVLGEAPSALTDLPQADVIFLGGSGGRLTDILDWADRALKTGGRLVINCVTVETLHGALAYMQGKRGYTSDAFQVQITRLKRVGKYHMSEALNPIGILTYTKDKQSGG